MNKIASLHIEEFTVFKKNMIEFSPGLNVLIGKNGTGKTHVLKVLYSFLKGGDTPPNFGPNSTLLNVFKVVSTKNLVRENSKTVQIQLNINLTNGDAIFADFDFRRTQNFENIQPLPNSIYIPPQEMLSIFEGFAALWDKREISFDKTYYDLAMALSLPALKDTQSFSIVLEALETQLKAKVIQENGRFYLEYEWGKIEAHLVAEGLRKLSQLIYLIGNGSINENTVLLWDEPEVHFNPSLIEAIVFLLRDLVGKGLQIFITTHDYLLSQRLSLISEYENPDFPIKFFCLENEGGDGIKIEEGKTLAEISSNPILDEFAEYYDFERNFFYKSPK